MVALAIMQIIHDGKLSGSKVLLNFVGKVSQLEILLHCMTSLVAAKWLPSGCSIEQFKTTSCNPKFEIYHWQATCI